MSNKLTLIINTEQKADDKKTAAFPRRRPRKLGRRRLQEGIRIFDLGYRLDGLVYAEIPFTDPNIADPVTFNANAASPFGAKADTSAHYDLIQTAVFTVAQSEWKNSYRQVDDDYTDNAGVSAGQFSITYKGQSYTLSAATSADVWSEGVFTPDQSPVNENFTIQPGRGDLVRTIGNSADYKWTTSNSYSADAVTFTAARDMDVYLMPSLVIGGSSALIDGPPQITELIGYFYAIWPREVQINPLSDHYAVNVIDNTYYAAGGFTAIAGATQANIDGYTVAYRVASLYKDKLPLFAANAEYDLFTDLWTRGTLDPGDYLNAGLFPDPPTLPSAPVNSLLMFVSGTIPPNGTLLGVVKKGGIFHYCWQDA